MSAETIPIAFVHGYTAEIHRLAAQRVSKLRGAVRVKTGVTGKSYNFNRLGPSDLAPITSRHAATAILNPIHSVRRVIPSDRGGALLLDKQDEWKILIAPGNDYARNHAESANRFYDDLIIAALGGSATSVAEDDTTSAVTLVSYKSGTRIFGSNSAMTFAKVSQAKRLLMEDEKIEGEFYACISPQALEDLLTEAGSNNMIGGNPLASRDFNDLQAVKNGTITGTWMGFNWIISNRLPIDGSLDRDCFFWEKQSVGLAIWEDIYTSAAIRSDLNDARQIYAAVSGGATRVEEAGVVKVQVREVATT